MAFNLLLVKRSSQYDSLADEEVQLLTLETWQDSPGVRQTYRALAKKSLEAQEADGIRIRAGDVRAIGRKLTWMQTIPPRLAYSSDELLP